MNLLSRNQQSNALNGLGPQFILEDFTDIEQWSEMFLSSIYCELSVQRLSHSLDAKVLSILLLATPFDQNHENFFQQKENHPTPNHL